MIIGITGLAGAGKDTFADCIIKQDSSYVKLKNAMFLKDITSILFNWNREWLDGETEESREWRETVDEFWNERVIDDLKPFTPRKALQYIGTELGRKLISPSLWVSGLEKYITDNKLSNVVISDVRFPEEIEMIHRLGGILIEVVRYLPDWYLAVLSYRKNTRPCASKEIYDKILSEHHSSETSWIAHEGINARIYNTQDIDYLHYLGRKLLSNAEAFVKVHSA